MSTVRNAEADRPLRPETRAKLVAVLDAELRKTA